MFNSIITIVNTCTWIFAVLPIMLSLCIYEYYSCLITNCKIQFWSVIATNILCTILINSYLWYMHVGPLNQVIDIANMLVTFCIMLIADLCFYFTLKDLRTEQLDAIMPVLPKKGK